MSKSTDIRILDVSYDFEEYQYRTPLKFGGCPDRQLWTAECAPSGADTRWERGNRFGIYDA